MDDGIVRGHGVANGVQPLAGPRALHGRDGSQPGQGGEVADHLRTLQRRVQEWRGIMAHKLVYAASDETPAAQHPMRELVLVDGGPER